MNGMARRGIPRSGVRRDRPSPRPKRSKPQRQLSVVHQSVRRDGARNRGSTRDFRSSTCRRSWDSADGWVMLNSHINVIIKDVRLGSAVSRDYIIDFNTPDFDGTWPRRIVSDRIAFALFYNNRAVEAMRAGDLRVAFANFKLAISKSSVVPATWVNLGALYSRHRHYESALSRVRAGAADQSQRKVGVDEPRAIERRDGQHRTR